MEREMMMMEYGDGFMEDPDILLTRKEAYYNLSPEAKDTLRMVINKPGKLSRMNKEEKMRAHVYTFLYRRKKQQALGFSQHDVYRRKLLMRKDFETIRDFLSLFSRGARIWT